jgi:hypothetical protein
LPVVEPPPECAAIPKIHSRREFCMRLHLRQIAIATALLTAATAFAQATPEPRKSDLDKVGDTVENIGAKPLKDLNIIQDKVHPDVERIMNEPYSLTGIKTCAQYKAAIGRLTAILGPDVDSPEFKKKDKTPAEQALSLGESAAGSLVPFSGVIRRLSGAEAKQNYAKAAIYAGSVRRAYLKGVARGWGCKV